MKRHIDKSKLNNLTTKVALIFMSLLIAVAAPIYMMIKTVYATECYTVSQCNDKISASQQDIDNYNAQAAQLAVQAGSLQSAIAQLQNQANAIQAQIDISQAKYDKLVLQIADTEKQIKDNQDALGVTIANMYVDDQITPLEMLASSKNISDYMDKQEYRSSVRDQLTSTINKIKDLKTQLDKQKVDIDRVLTDQKAQKSDLVAKQAEQQQLLNDTQTNANAYLQLSSGLQAQIAQLKADRTGLGTIKGSGVPIQIGSVYYNHWSGNTECGGGYSYCYVLDTSVSDDWGLGLAGECVHYVAWALADRGYYIPYNAFNLNNGYGGGNADLWVAVSTGDKFASIVSDPQNNAQKDDVAVIPTSGVGHVGIVESNYGDGWVRISQYNYDVPEGSFGMYSTIDLKVTSNIQFLRFSK